MMFSIIIPNYNKSKYLIALIQSIKVQTFTDFEVLIIDDCSTDNSLSIVKSLIINDNRFKLMKNDSNRGVAFTRNRGLKAATADYCLFIDADDSFSNSDLLQDVYSLISDYQADFIFLKRDYYGKKLKPKLKIIDKNINRVSTVFFKIQDKQSFLVRYNFPVGGSASTIFSRNLLSDFDYFDESITQFEDWLFFSKILSKSEKVFFYNKSSVFINYDKNSLSREKKSSPNYQWGYVYKFFEAIDYKRAAKKFFWIEASYYFKTYNITRKNTNFIEISHFIRLFTLSKFYVYCLLRFIGLHFK